MPDPFLSHLILSDYSISTNDYSVLPVTTNTGVFVNIFSLYITPITHKILLILTRQQICTVLRLLHHVAWRWQCQLRCHVPWEDQSAYPADSRRQLPGSMNPEGVVVMGSSSWVRPELMGNLPGASSSYFQPGIGSAIEGMQWVSQWLGTRCLSHLSLFASWIYFFIIIRLKLVKAY